MKGFLSISILFYAVLAVTYADVLPDPESRPDQEKVPPPPDDIPPYDPQPHPETRPSKPFPSEQPSFDPPPYPGTKTFEPFPDGQPSFDPPPYAESAPEQGPVLSRLSRSLKNENDKITIDANQKKHADVGSSSAGENVVYDITNNPTKSSGSGANDAGASKNQAKPQFGAGGSYPYD